jgi:Glycosyl hydrolases family 18
MTRKNAQLPWGGSGHGGGLYGGGRSTSYGRIAALCLIVVGVVALGYVLFGRACGGTSCDTAYCATGQSIAAPDGYEFVTKIYQYNTNKKIAAGNDVLIQLPLSKATTDARNLGFFHYVTQSQAWEPVTAAQLDGAQVAATLHDTPDLIAVLRRNSPAGSVVAYLPHATPSAPVELHPDAVGKITMLHTRDFQPGADGGVTGDLSAVKADSSFEFIPTVSANADLKGSVAIVSSLLASSALRTAHVQAITKLVDDKALAGIDIAYQDLALTDRTSFTLFVNELAQQMHARNKKLTLTLPPPIKTADRIDEGAYDWGELGNSADVLQMTPYRDQGRYRADIPEILTYLTGKVQATKLILTVSPYATEKAPDGIRTMTITDAMNIATKLSIRAGADGKLTTNSVVSIVGVNVNKEDGRSGVTWDTASATVAFTYENNGGRTVWLENFFSIGFKLEFISQYKLGGVGIEDASKNTYLGNIWTALVPFITSGQPVLMQPNSNDLQPAWNASKGTIQDSTKGAIKWNTPADAGTYTVTLTLSDGVSKFQSEIPANVQAKDTKTPAASPTAGG